MFTKLKTLLVGIIWISGFSSIAQPVNLQGSPGNALFSSGASSSIIGDPYLVEEFESGKLYTVDGKEMEALLRFNMALNKFEAIVNDQVIELYSHQYPKVELEFYNKESEMVEQYTFQNKFKIPGKGAIHYFLVIESNPNYQIIGDLRKDVSVSSSSSYGQETEEIKKYVLNNSYYILKDDKLIQIPEISKSTFFQVFGENKKKLKEYIKGENLKVNSVDDLKQIIEFLYSNQII